MQFKTYPVYFRYQTNKMVFNVIIARTCQFGAYYLELVQTENGNTIAKAKANIWQGKRVEIQMELGIDYNNI